MSQKANRSDIAIFCAIIGGFVLVVVLTLVFGGSGRALGAALMVLGAAAIVFGRAVAIAKRSIGERILLWSGRNTIRPFTFRLWGFGLIVLGLLQIFGL